MKNFLQIVNTINMPRVGENGLPLQAILNTVYVVSALLAIIFIAIGGFKYTVSGGDPQGTAKAKNTIIYATIGLVIVLSAFVITSFVFSRL